MPNLLRGGPGGVRGLITRPLDTLRRSTILAVAYYATGMLGLQLAIPPGYATAVWPPSGIALAGMLLYGGRILPAVVVGSFAVNIGTSFDPSGGWASAQSVFLALAIGCGAALQAAAGAALIRRFVGVPLELLREQDVAKFFVLAGPMSCLISSSMNVGILLLVGSIPLDQAPNSWWTWWVGDSMGAIVVAPLLLVWLAEPRDVWRRRAVPITIPVACLLAATVLLFFWASEIEAARIRVEFQKQAERVTERVESNFDHAIRVVESFANLQETTSAADQAATFVTFARRTLATNPEIQALTWNPRVTAAERTLFEQRARLSGYQDFRIVERTTAGMVSAGPRAEYVAVLHTEPAESDHLIRGFDVASEPTRLAALRRACETGRATMTAPIHLLPEKSPDQYGVLVFVPIYRTGMPNAQDERCHATRGFVTGVFRLENVMRTALGSHPDLTVTVALREAPSQAGSLVWTNAGGSPSVAPGGLVHAGLVDAGGRTWSIVLTTTSSYDTWRPWVTLNAGMLLTGLFSALLLVVTGRPVIIERYSAKREAELAEINQRLQREVAERQQAEEALLANESKLQQARKMEAIGRLAGGVAHDFNNLLTIILGYSAQLLEDLGETGTAADDVREIQRAGESAARLTKQLLAFSRRQVLQPIALDVSREIDRIHELIGRLLGEDITLVIKPERGLRCVKADRGFVEQVLFNLAANARDAMRRGGELTVTTAPLELLEPRSEEGFVVPAGHYVVLSVADTGVGMDAPTRANVFEPFFSTKGDQGTGLGLATVYGIVKQSGGFIAVESEPGHGTTFRIYLPAVEDAPVDVSPAHVRPVVAQQAAHILLVEDDDAVRSLVSNLLRRQGYSVVEAGHPVDGLHLARSSVRPLDLLITDMVMPVMHGRALAEVVTLLHPEMGTLFMSGYTDQIVEAGQNFLHKPFTPDAILWKVKDALSRRACSRQATDTAIAS